MEPPDAGVASALINTTQPAAGLVHGYTTAFIVGAVFLSASAVVSLALIKARRQDVTAADPEEQTLTELAEVI